MGQSFTFDAGLLDSSGVAVDEQGATLDAVLPQKLEASDLLVENVESDSITLNANGGNQNVTFSVAKDGYTAIGLVGWWTNQARMLYAGAFINRDAQTANIYCLNNATTAWTGKVRAYVLYVKNS